jgi:hypothetical protein
MNTYNTEYKLEIPEHWITIKNDFNDIVLFDDKSREEEIDNTLLQEDILHLSNGQFHLDLGWYGSDEEKLTTGIMLVLFRGQDWLNCELLELIRSKSIKYITREINEIIRTVDNEFYSGKVGYKIDENDLNDRSIGDHLQFSLRKNLNKIMK